MADPAGYFQRGGSFYSSIPPTGGSGAPTAGTWRARQLAVDDTGALWLCTVAGTPGTWVAAGGSASGPPFIGTGTVASTGMFRAANGAANGIYWRNNADNGDIGWSVGAFDNITMAGSATALYLGGGGTKGTVEKLRVGNAATTGDNTANAMFVASATTSKPIVVQGLASQSAKVFEAQDSTGAILASISAAGAVVGASFSGAGSVASTGVLRQANGGGSGVYWRNNAGDGDIGWNVGAFDNIATQGTTALYVTAGGARGTVEKLRVANTATTADNTANALLLASATTSKPLVVQGLASQSAVLTDWQTSTGTSVASVSAAGTVTGAALTAASAGVITGGTAVLSGSVSIGSSPAVTGELKLPAGGAINFRATGGGADIAGISLNSSDQLQVGAPVVPGADNTRALGSTSRRWSQINATKLQLTSTGSLGTVEQLRVGADPITGDNTANALLVASATTSKPLVVQGKASQSANLFEVQDSTGASLFSVGPSGTVTSASLAATYVPLAPTATTFTGDHTAALTDIGKVIEITNGDLIIPTNATVAFPVGQTLEVLDCGATSAVNVVNASGVQVQGRGGKFTSAGQYASFVLRQRSTDVWHVAGDLVAFAPDMISGLVFWFKGNSTYWQDSGRTTPAVADGDPVAAWDDSSVGANHATTATAGYRPTLKTGANGINGVSVLRWDGTDDNLVSAASASTKPFTLFAVCKPTSFAAGRAIVGAPSAGGMSTVITTGGKQEALKSGTAVIGDSTTALTAAAACIIELTYSSSGGFAFYKAGVADGSGTGNQTFTSMSTVLGKDPGGGGSTFLGDIAEIIKYDAVLTANQLQAVENYLGNRYGIAVS